MSGWQDCLRRSLLESDSKEKAFYSLRSIKGFVFLLLMQASLQCSEKQNPFIFR
jgi:hypothetical protein